MATEDPGGGLAGGFYLAPGTPSPTTSTPRPNLSIKPTANLMVNKVLKSLIPRFADHIVMHNGKAGSRRITACQGSTIELR
jgi:hypothetical protein